MFSRPGRYLSAESVGNAVITATAADGSGVTDSCIIRVVNPVTGIEVVPDSLRLFVGDSQKLGVNVYPDNATIKDVVWKSANESIAVVDEDGEVFAIVPVKLRLQQHLRMVIISKESAGFM